jgi:hypothetical protein
MISFAAITFRAVGVLAMKIARNLSPHRLLTFSHPDVMIISNQLPIQQLIFAKCVCGELP